MPRANGARVARNLGRLVPLAGGGGTSSSIAFSTHASYRIGASDVAGSGGSIVGWFRLRPCGTSTTNLRLFTLADAALNNYVSIYFPTGKDQEMNIQFVRGAANIVLVASGVRYVVDALTHFALVWNASGAELYLNGVKVWVSASVDPRPTFDATPRFTFGNWVAGSLAPDGDLGGELALYNRKLTRGEVEAHYFDGEVPSAPVSAWGPTGWPATGTTVTLTGGSGNNGTITSGVLMNEPAEQKPALAVRQRAGSRFQQNLPSASMGGWAVADHATLKPVNFSVEARVRFDAWAAGSLGAGSLPASNTRGLVVKTSGLLWNDGWGLVEVAGSTGLRTIRLFISSYLTGASFTVAPNTKEVHVLATHDGTTARLYVDGELVGSSAVALTQVATSLRVGCGYDTGAAAGYSHEGSIRDVRYYSRALSQVEARARFQDNLDIESGLIAAWDLSESRRNSTYNNIVGVVAKDRVGGFDAVWTRGANNSDADDIGARRAPRRKNVERVNIQWLSGSARTALDASLVVGTGSFSVAGTFLFHSWNANTNNIITASDDATYASGWVLVYTPITDATASLVGYVGSAGPNAYGTTSGRVTIQRGKRFRLAFVADAVTGKASWYIDGVRLSEVAVAAWNLPNTPRFCVGLSPAIGSAVGMRAADVRYAVGRAWTKEEIEADANGVPDALSGVTHAWPMDDQADGATSLRATKGPVALSTLSGSAAVGSEALANDYTETPKVQALGAAPLFSNAQWTKGNCTFSGTVAGPDGVTLDAENLVEDSAITYKQAALSISSEKATYAAYVFSVDVAASGRDWVALATGAGGSFQWFNVSTGALGTRSGSQILDSWLSPRGNGYYRCNIVTNQNYFQIFAASANSVIGYLGDGRVAVKTANAQVTRLSAASRNQGIALAPYPNVAYDVGSPDIKSGAVQQSTGVRVISGVTPVGVSYSGIAIASDFSFRVRFTPAAGSASGVDRIMTVGEYPTGILLCWQFNNRLGAYWALGLAGTAGLGPALPLGKEADIVVAFNRTLRRVRLFIDGNFAGEATGTGALNDVASTTIAIGTLSGGTAGRGTYRQFRAYRRELIEGDAALLFRGQEPEGAIVNWALDEGVGSTVVDKVAGLNGTFAGAAANIAWTRD